MTKRKLDFLAKKLGYPNYWEMSMKAQLGGTGMLKLQDVIKRYTGEEVSLEDMAKFSDGEWWKEQDNGKRPPAKRGFTPHS